MRTTMCLKTYEMKDFVVIFQKYVVVTVGEISSDLDGTKQMMENLNIIQISHLTFECSWLMVPYDILIAGPA